MYLRASKPNSRSVDAANSSPLGTFARSSSSIHSRAARLCPPGGEEEDGPAELNDADRGDLPGGAVEDLAKDHVERVLQPDEVETDDDSEDSDEDSAGAAGDDAAEPAAPRMTVLPLCVLAG